MLILFVLSVVALLAHSPVLSQEPSALTMPDDFEQVDVFLLTVGRGQQIHALFGHSILRVVDRARRRDDNFNWGMFDFSSPLFAWTFYRGDLDYQLGVMRFPELLVHYRDYEQRSLVQDRLNLTVAQKRALLSRLVENAKPHNLSYKYFQFRDNCATRIRDHLDAALGGRLRQHFASHRSPVVFRDHIRRNAAPLWFVALGLDYLSNSMLDRPIGPWDEMFLPSAMRHHLVDVPAFGDDGKILRGINLLSDHQTLIDLPEPQLGSRLDAWIAFLIGLPVVLGCLLLWIQSTQPRSLNPASLSLAIRVFGVTTAVFGLWSSVWGTVMLLNWCVSYYDELQHNALLMLMYPIDWVFVVYGISLVRSGRMAGGRWQYLATLLSLLHIVSFSILALLWILGLLKQDISAPLASTGVLGLLYYLTMLAHSQRRQLGG